MPQWLRAKCWLKHVFFRLIKVFTKAWFCSLFTEPCISRCTPFTGVGSSVIRTLVLGAHFTTVLTYSHPMTTVLTHTHLTTMLTHIHVTIVLTYTYLTKGLAQYERLLASLASFSTFLSRHWTQSLYICVSIHNFCHPYLFHSLFSCVSVYTIASFILMRQLCSRSWLLDNFASIINRMNTVLTSLTIWKWCL